MSRQVDAMRKSRSSEGFSLLELMIAVAVMAIAMIGGLAMIVIGIGRNSSMRMDTSAANVAQTVLEDIAAVQAQTNTTVNITDCTGNNLAIKTNPGGSALQPNPPNSPGVNPGDIDFTQPAVAGYVATYNMCAPGGQPIPFQVRWAVQLVGTDPKGKSWGKLVTVAARQPLALNNGNIYYSPPVTLRTVVGM